MTDPGPPPPVPPPPAEEAPAVPEDALPPPPALDVVAEGEGDPEDLPPLPPMERASEAEVDTTPYDEDELTKMAEQLSRMAAATETEEPVTPRSHKADSNDTQGSTESEDVATPSAEPKPKPRARGKSVVLKLEQSPLAQAQDEDDIIDSQAKKQEQTLEAKELRKQRAASRGRRRTTVGTYELNAQGAKVELDYEGPEISQIADLLDMFFQRDGLVPLGNYTSFWGRLSDPSLSTFFLVALIAKLVAMETEDGRDQFAPISMLLKRYYVRDETPEGGSKDKGGKDKESAGKRWSLMRLAVKSKPMTPDEKARAKQAKQEREKEKKEERDRKKALKKKGKKGQEEEAAAVVQVKKDPMTELGLKWVVWPADAKPTQVPMCLINTLAYVALFHVYDPNEYSLRRAIETCKELKGEIRHAVMVDQVLDLIAPKDLPSIRKMVAYAADQHCHRGIGALPSDLSNNPLLSVPAYIYSFLRHRFATSTTTKYAVMDTIAKLLSSPQINDSRLFSLLHMLREFLAMTHIFDSETIHNLIDAVRPFFLWPLPFGSMAQELLSLLNAELRAPGHAMREKFVRENPQLARGEDTGSGIGRERHVHMFIDEGRAKVLETLHRGDDDAKEDSFHTIRANLLWNIFSACLGDYDTPPIGRLSRDATATFYNHACEIMHHAMGIDDEDEAVEYRNKELEKLAADLNDSLEHTSDIGRTVNRTPMPAFPSLHFEFCKVTVGPLLPLQPVAPSLYLPQTSSYNAFQHIVSVYKQERLTERTTVRVGVAGGDGTLHNVLCGYVGMMHRAPESFALLDFQFYVIPIGQPNTIASWLSAYDGWYAQHIGALANPRPTSPHLSSMDHLKLPKKALQLLGLHEDGTTNAQSPVNILTEDLHHYIRGATYVTPIEVYQAELWDSDPGMSFMNPVRPIIPFCCRIEIGMPAYITAFKEINNIPPAQSAYQQLKQNKKFSFTPMTLSFTFHEASFPQTEASKYSTIKAKCYKSIVVNNVPAADDKGVTPSPSSRWLEMQAKECVGVQAGTRTAYTSKTKTNLTSYHVSYLEIETSEPVPFPVKIDGQYLGEFFKIRIQRVKSPVNPAESVTFPVTSFFPLDLTD